MLHVADDRILPFEKIDGAIRADFNVGGAEIGIIGLYQRLHFFANEGGIGIGDLVLEDAEKADDILNQEIALHGIRKLAARKNFHPGAGPGALIIKLGGLLMP